MASNFTDNSFTEEEEYILLHNSLTSSFEQLHKKLDERQSYLSQLLFTTYQQKFQSKKDKSIQLLQMKQACESFTTSMNKYDFLDTSAGSQVLIKPILDQIEKLEKERNVVRMEFNTEEIEFNISNLGDFIITRNDEKLHNFPISDRSISTKPISNLPSLEVAKSLNIPGICGFKTFDHNCFINSILQCLVHTSPLQSYFRDDSNILLSEKATEHGLLIQTFRSIFKEYWSCKSYSCVDAQKYKEKFKKVLPYCTDAFSHIILLFQILHKELNVPDRKLNLELQGSCENDQDKSQIPWFQYSLNNNSIISQNFHGQMKYSLTCNECKNVETSFEAFSTLSLPLAPLQKDKNRFIKLTFVSLRPLALPILYKVSVEKNSSIRDLCVEISNLSGVDPDKMIVCDVYSHRFHKIFDHNEGINGISERDDIFVYETPIDRIDEPNIMCLPVCNREVRETKYSNISSHSYVHHYLFGLPLILPIPRNTTTYTDLYRICIYYMQRYIKKQTECTSKNEETNISMDFDISGYSPEMFKLKLVNAYGSAEMGDLINDGQPLRLMNRSVIAMEWDSNYRNLYDDAELKKFQDNSTLQNEINFQKCFKHYLLKGLQENEIKVCSKCHKQSQTIRRRELWKLPDYLILNLRRFECEKKLNMFVNFPLKLNLTEFLQHTNIKDGENHVYELYAVCNHYGSLEEGNYTSSVKVNDGDFYLFDDTSISRFVSSDYVVTKAAFILFYKSI